MYKTFDGYCSCHDEERSITVEYLKVPPNHDMMTSYKRSQFIVCHDCTLSNAFRSDDVCPIFAAAPLIVR